MEERKEDKEEHTWPEEPCSSFREEVERIMGKNGENKMIEVIFAVMHLIGVGMILLVTLFFGILAWSARDERE